MVRFCSNRFAWRYGILGRRRLPPKMSRQQSQQGGGGNEGRLHSQTNLSFQEKGSSRLFTIHYFLVRSSGSSAHRDGRPSWFHMYRGDGRRGLKGLGEVGEKIEKKIVSLRPKPSTAPQVDLTSIQDGRPISTILLKYRGL